MPVRPSGFSAQVFENIIVTEWGSGALCPLTERQDFTDALSILEQHIAWLAADEQVFGPSSALRDYGRVFSRAGKNPGWLIKGTAKRCYENAASYASVRNDVNYAEGYVIDPCLPIPIEHAWLVDCAGEVVDPTLENVKEHVYLGVAFAPGCVRQMLEANQGEAGILSNLHRFHQDSIRFERTPPSTSLP
ncbi:hypothetical protein [Rhizobium sp.]|uniref:hypothetical protein n=1 Tax=Rhizobium sp. TaxID=391 RepID=UPI0028AFA9F6